MLSSAQQATASPPAQLLQEINLLPSSSGTADLAKVQKALAWTGFYRGPTHGRDTADTREAVAAFVRSLGQTSQRRLNSVSRDVLFARSEATQEGYRFTRKRVDWFGIELDIPMALFGQETLVSGDGDDEIHFTASSHPSAAQIRLWQPSFNGRVSPQEYLTGVQRSLQRSENDPEVIASGRFPSAYYITYLIEGFRVMQLAQEQQGIWKVAEYSVREDYYWTMRPVMAEILTSLDLFATDGLSSQQKRQRISEGDFPGSELVPDWFKSVVGNGSGSLVSSQGHVLTNLHVIDGCDWISVNGSEAELVGADARLDLAVIRADQIANRRPISFRESNPRLGEQIAVMGYPIFEISRALNYTTGIVSSATGIRGDRTRVQITAPIQPGNSGGPVLDTSGRQVAVVVAKASASLQLESNVENVGWVIRGEQAVEFLRRFGVEPLVETQPTGMALPSAEVVDEWRSRILRIECHAYSR